MFNIEEYFENEEIKHIITRHVSKKVAELVEWHTSLGDFNKICPDNMSYGQARQVVYSLYDLIKDEEAHEMTLEQQFALACILEEEIWYKPGKQYVSARFDDAERQYLMRMLPEPEIERYEDFDALFYELLPDSSYLDLNPLRTSNRGQ